VPVPPLPVSPPLEVPVPGADVVPLPLPELPPLLGGGVGVRVGVVAAGTVGRLGAVLAVGVAGRTAGVTGARVGLAAGAGVERAARCTGAFPSAGIAAAGATAKILTAELGAGLTAAARTCVAGLLLAGDPAAKAIPNATSGARPRSSTSRRRSSG
jgi:hypothetical protein